MRDLRPAPGLARITAYQVPRPVTPVELHLDGNEGLAPPSAVLDGLMAQDPELLRRYPDARGLERLLAERLGVRTDHVLVTAGADDAIDRLCRAVLTTGRRMIVPEPTFSMIERFVLLAGGDFVSIPWTDAPYPIEAVLAAVDERTAAIAVVSPNNPTGGVATAEDVRRLSAAAPQALILVDHAYMEFGAEDLTPLAAALPNVVVLRTLSKAWGLAGLRVGFAVARPELIGWLQTAGHPFAVSGPSLVLAHQWLEQGGSAVEAFVAEVRRERPLLEALLARLGGRVAVSQGNFAFARFDNAVDDALWVRDGLAGLSMGVRAFPGDPLLADAVRITCPGDRGDFTRLTAGLETVLAPEAILFDMDGVLADVSRSYRQAIVETVRHFGEEITAADIAAETGLGDANNDWVLSQRLLSKRGVTASLEEVTRIFEALYQGTDQRPGLRESETLLVDRNLLEALSRRYRLGVVTGRPRADAQRFLEKQAIVHCFDTVVCMGDAAAKPDPAPVRLALERLGVTRAWMVGDTPDDIRAARAAGVLPLGAAFQQDDPPDAETLLLAGAARVLDHPDELSALALALALKEMTHGEP